jgi:serine/threonine protein kinase
MTGGSVFDFIHNYRGVLNLPAVVRMAIDVSKGMDYLHQCNIIHRDLKTANLLMDENEVTYINIKLHYNKPLIMDILYYYKYSSSSDRHKLSYPTCIVVLAIAHDVWSFSDSFVHNVTHRASVNFDIIVSISVIYF